MTRGAPRRSRNNVLPIRYSIHYITVYPRLGCVALLELPATSGSQSLAGSPPALIGKHNIFGQLRYNLNYYHLIIFRSARAKSIIIIVVIHMEFQKWNSPNKSQ